MEETPETWDNLSEEERKSVRERRLMELEVETQNPMYAWLALWQRLTSATNFDTPNGPAITEDVVIPAWIARYLYTAADGLSDLASGLDPRIDLETSDFGGFASLEEALTAPAVTLKVPAAKIEPDAAMKLVPSVLGLTGSGWNAFAALQSTAKRMGEFRLYDSVRAEGGSAKDALARVRETYGIKSDRQAMRRIQEGRALAEWEWSKPTP